MSALLIGQSLTQTPTLTMGEDNNMFGFGDVVAILVLTWVCMLYIAMDLAGVI